MNNLFFKNSIKLLQMKKSEKLATIKKWMDSEESMEAISNGGDEFLVGKIMAELEVGSEKTARNYLAEIRHHKPAAPNRNQSQFPMVAKGYDSPLKRDGSWERLVDSDEYAFLEVEQREFNPATGRKKSKPRVISLNRHDAAQFLGVRSKKAGQKWAIPSMKEAQGLYINAVLFVPKSFGLSFEVDEWGR